MEEKVSLEKIIKDRSSQKHIEISNLSNYNKSNSNKLIFSNTSEKNISDINFSKNMNDYNLRNELKETENLSDNKNNEYKKEKFEN